MSSKPSRPQLLGTVLAGLLRETGLEERVRQAEVIPEWPKLVGPQIAVATEPLSISADGTLYVAVKTNAWMTELSLLEPELLRALNAQPDRPRIQRIRWQLKR